MDALPELILDYLQDNVSDLLSPACLCVDQQGQLLGWSGSLGAYPLPELKVGVDVEAFLPLLVGLDGLDEPLVFSLVNLDESSVVNIHLLPRTAGGMYVLLLDALAEHNSMQIYQQKANEVQLLNARLKKVLKQLEKTQAELQLKKAEAEEASRLKSQFIAGMSHEFRTPLTSILGYTEMLERGMLDEQQLSSATTAISSGAQHLMSLIDNVLDQARFEAGEMELHLEVVDLVAMISDIQAMFEPLARKKGLALRVQGHDVPNDCWIRVDGMRLRQLMINLCNNAIKYTDKGRVTVEYHVQGTGGSDAQLSFKVIDTGPGIAEAEQHAIFNAFHRVSAQSAKAGAGLGLAISRQILELMGGGLNLQSQVGQGSEFELTVPVERVAPVDVCRNETIGALSGSHTILVAEDNPDVVQVVELFLQGSGYQVLLAETGQQARDMALSEAPSLVLMDMNMPVMDGYTAVKQLRDKGFNQPILALTASPAPQDRQRALEAGCNNYLLKPIAMDELLAKVQEYVNY